MSRLFTETYQKMMPYITMGDRVLELGSRPKTRGFISREMFKSCKQFVTLDLNKARLAGESICADYRTFSCVDFNVIITTALMHHYTRDEAIIILWKMLAEAGRTVIVSGPNSRIQLKMYGDHKWHLVAEDIVNVAAKFDYKTTVIEHDDHEPAISFHPEAKDWVKDGTLTCVMERN